MGSAGLRDCGGVLGSLCGGVEHKGPARRQSRRSPRIRVGLPTCLLVALSLLCLFKSRYPCPEQDHTQTKATLHIELPAVLEGSLQRQGLAGKLLGGGGGASGAGQRNHPRVLAAGTQDRVQPQSLVAAGELWNPMRTEQASAGRGHRRYGYLLAMSNHKTGTYQLSCLIHAISAATGLPEIWQPEHVNAVSVSYRLAGPTPPAVRPTRPILIGGGHALEQLCFAPARWAGGRTFVCPNSKFPCGVDGTAALSLDGCIIPLPATHRGAPGLVHFHRNPWDIVISALWYHRQFPVPRGEGWLETKMETMIQHMAMQGVPLRELELLGVAHPDTQQRTYAEVLRSLPEEQAVQLQFWNSAWELYSMARQYRILKGMPGSHQVRYDDAQRNLYAAVLPLVREFYPKDVSGIMRRVFQAKCDPNSWTAAELNRSNHVTSAKRPTGAKESLQRVLWSRPSVRRHLCTLAAAMDYLSPFPCLADGAAVQPDPSVQEGAANDGSQRGSKVAVDAGYDGSRGGSTMAVGAGDDGSQLGSTVAVDAGADGSQSGSNNAIAAGGDGSEHGSEVVVDAGRDGSQSDGDLAIGGGGADDASSAGAAAEVPDEGATAAGGQAASGVAGDAADSGELSRRDGGVVGGSQLIAEADASAFQLEGASAGQDPSLSLPADPA